MAVWKEQAVTVEVPGEEIVLEAVWQAGERGARGGGVVAPPHPLYGGSIENPVVNDIAYGLHRAGLPSLRFNWRGVNASQGEATGEPDAARADYAAALAHLADTAQPPLVGAGYSFGAAAAVAVALADRRIGRLVLVAPPLAMLESLDLSRLEIPLHAIVGGEDQFAPSDRLSQLLESAGQTKLEVIPGVDHFFAGGGLSQIAEFVAAAVSE
jgi:alpha/beta superfamily hydrolase